MSILQGKKVLVTGGGGFLGREICRLLQEEGSDVRSYSRNRYSFLEQAGVSCIEGSLTDVTRLTRAVKDCDAVIHAAALAGIWGRKKSFFSVNYDGTKNLLRAMKKGGVSTLVYTSSPSVVSRRGDICGENESIPYADSHLGWYSLSKKMAEEEVLRAHGSDGLSTLSLRPHLIWGPGDPHFLPRLLAKRSGNKLIKVGPLSNLVDVIYIENAGKAHVQALKAILSGKNCGGKAYFLGQKEPVRLWDFLDQLLEACGQKPVPGAPRLPFPLAYGAGYLLEKFYGFCGIYDREPPMTRFLALQLSHSHYFSHLSASKSFGYSPDISVQEGLRRLKGSFASVSLH